MIEDIEAREKAATALTGPWAVQFWSDFNNMPHREFAEKYPWINRCPDVRTQERLLYAVARGAIDYLLAQLKDREEKLQAVEDFVEEQYKDGVCLWCGWASGGPLDFHCCPIGHLDRILKGGRVMANHEQEVIDAGRIMAEAAALRAKVARLEGEKAALAAALAGILREFNPKHLDKVSGTTVGSDADATLSDGGEGKHVFGAVDPVAATKYRMREALETEGWLPPEVREQVREALERIVDPGELPDNCTCHWDSGVRLEMCGEHDPTVIAAAALDALKGE